MAYLTRAALENMGFRRLGRDVRVSDRAAIYEPDQIEIGDFSRIDDFCVVNGKVSIGRNVHITVFCNIAGGRGGVTLSDFSTLAYGCCLFSTTDDYSGRTMTNSTVHASFKDVQSAPILIGEHTILGASTIVFPGVTVPIGCAAGAQTVFRKSVEPWGVYVGNPARRIKDRSRNVASAALTYLCLEETAAQEKALSA